MPKRHRPGHASRRHLENVLAQVDELIERKRWVEARARLQELDRRYPDNGEILSELLNVAYELHDMRTYLNACERLLKLDPHDADLTLALAGAYLGNVRPASALATFRRFLQQFPHHERAAEARQEMTELEARMSDLRRNLGVSGEASFEIAMLHGRTLGLIKVNIARGAKQRKSCSSVIPIFPLRSTTSPRRILPKAISRRQSQPPNAS